MSASSTSSDRAKVFHVVDLFAGPGGLAEGFSTYEAASGHQPFNIALSVEKDPAAHATLRLRSFLRQFDGEYPAEYYDWLNSGKAQPNWELLYPEEWENACEEAMLAELGTDAGNSRVAASLKRLKALNVETVVIGGPPCQAYSLVGRARNAGIASYVPSEDKRHFLYQQYISILSILKPAAFVMENVKGMLSSSMAGQKIFEQVLADLRKPSDDADYELFALRIEDGVVQLRATKQHADYLIGAEHFGVPQARHRVIIVGLRRDVATRQQKKRPKGLSAKKSATLRDVLEGMPPLRSGLSRDDGRGAWLDIVTKQMTRACNAIQQHDLSPAGLAEAAWSELERFAEKIHPPPLEDNQRSDLPRDCPSGLKNWLADPLLRVTTAHATRRHMADDLARYFFCAVFAQVTGRAPKSREFPPGLAPAHASWESGAFADRFRSQPWDLPATTITSHIHKDGHYFIHPDPQQCRSLTVREAARLQTFPDNYTFLGTRTQQYIQVGNAVPPYLAHQIAELLWPAIGS